MHRRYRRWQNQNQPLDPDTDHGGVKDGTEDANHNGVGDGGETDPNDPADDRVMSGGGGAGGVSDLGGSTGTAGGGSAGSGGGAGNQGTLEGRRLLVRSSSLEQECLVVGRSSSRLLAAGCASSPRSASGRQFCQLRERGKVSRARGA